MEARLGQPGCLTHAAMPDAASVAAEVLDGASLFQLFSKLEGLDLARAACVCRAWQAVASSEPLWAQLCQRLEHADLFKDDVLEALGGSFRLYYAWRYPFVHRRVNKLCILDNSGAGQSKLVLTEVYQATPGSGYLARGASTLQPPGSYIGGAAAKPTWSPLGGLLAYSSLQPGRMAVVVVDSQGRQVAECVLDDPHSAAFYLHWALCGTRLLLLTAWPSGPVALKALDLGPALLPAGAGRVVRVKRPVLLSTARPLFLSCCPQSTRVLWHGNMRDYGLVDCATVVDEDGSEHDRFFANPAQGGGRSPQWIVDAQGRQWLLLAALKERPEGQQAWQQQQGNGPAQGENEEGAGELLLLPVDALEEAYEMGGSMLSMELIRNLSTRVSSLGDVNHLSYTASSDGSIVAWAEACQVSVRFMAPRAAVRVLTLELPGRHGAPVSVMAMQWAPDGRKLLLLALDGNTWFWAVWYAPLQPPSEELAGAAELSGRLGCLMVCPAHRPSAAFQSEYLPFFDQFAQSTRLWSPASDAFCYAAVDASPRPSLRDIGRESSYAYVQHVPSPEQLQMPAGPVEGPSSSSGGSTGAGSSSGAGSSGRGRRQLAGFMGQGLGEGVALPVYDSPSPCRIMPGSVVSWSFT